MSLLLSARKVWRYKFLTVPILVLVLVGAFYVIAIKQPVYEASSTSILVNPPAPPTDLDIARDPRLGRIGTDNPYTRYSDQSVVVQILASRMSSDAARRELAKLGADPQYTVEPSAEFGFTAPIVQITGTGPTPAAAVRTANVVGLAVTRELGRMQQARGVAAKYRIETQQVVAPHDAKLKASGQLRSLVAVFALGAILLFVVISVADALIAIRSERAQRVDHGMADEMAVGAPLVPLDFDSRDESPSWPEAWPASGPKRIA
jgi:hypothetical protein